MTGIKLKHDTWVLVADGEKALFLRNDGDALYPDLTVVRKLHDENPPTREQGTDRPGRHIDGPSAHRSAVEDTDWHRVAKERFADEIAERLYGLAHDGARRDDAGRAAAGAGRIAQEAAQGSREPRRCRNPQDADQPADLRDRGAAAGRVSRQDARNSRSRPISCALASVGAWP